MQSADLDLLAAFDLVKFKKKENALLRSDTDFQKMIKIASHYSDTIDIEEFSTLPYESLRRKKKMIGER